MRGYVVDGPCTTEHVGESGTRRREWVEFVHRYRVVRVEQEMRRVQAAVELSARAGRSSIPHAEITARSSVRGSHP